MKKNYLKYVMLTLVASFTLALTACGGGGFNSEKAQELCTKFDTNYSNFSNSDAKALFNQYKACCEEALKLYKKYDGKVPRTDEINKLCKLSDDMMEILDYRLKFKRDFSKVYKDFSKYETEYTKRVEALYNELKKD